MRFVAGLGCLWILLGPQVLVGDRSEMVPVEADVWVHPVMARLCLPGRRRDRRLRRRPHRWPAWLLAVVVRRLLPDLAVAVVLAWGEAIHGLPGWFSVGGLVLAALGEGLLVWGAVRGHRGCLRGSAWLRRVRRYYWVAAWLAVLAAGWSNGVALALGVKRVYVDRNAQAEIRVVDGKMIMRLPENTSLSLRVDGEHDERLGIVLARQFRTAEGKAVFSFEQVSKAFGKNDRRDSHNHLQQFGRAGESLAGAVLQARRGRPGRLDAQVEKGIARYWQEHPLASLEETIEWVNRQPWPEDTRLPDLETLEREGNIQGNLVSMRNHVRRLLEAQSAGLRTDRQVKVLMELVDEQDRVIQAAGLERPLRPDVLVEAKPEAVSRVVAALAKRLSTLCAGTREQDVEGLEQTVGAGRADALLLSMLYSMLRLSFSQVGALVGRSKSQVCRSVMAAAKALDTLDPFPAATHFSGVLCLDEKWVMIPKSFSKKEQEEGRKWRYVHVAVDGVSGDLLHINVFETCDSLTIRLFLRELRAMGIRPRAVVTDMLSSYHAAIGEVFGPGVAHHYCLFHHLQAVRTWMREHLGKDWKKTPSLLDFVRSIDAIYRCKDSRTAHRRYLRVLRNKDALVASHPAIDSFFPLLAARFPLVVNAIGSKLIPTTNDITERTIKAFNRHYRNMAGFESIETALLQARLFRFLYRLTPMMETKDKSLRGLCPLERAGWNLSAVPLALHIRRFALLARKDPVAAVRAAGEPHAPSYRIRLVA